MISIKKHKENPDWRVYMLRIFTGGGCCAMLQLWKTTTDRKYYEYVREWADTIVRAERTIHLHRMEDYKLDFIKSGKGE